MSYEITANIVPLTFDHKPKKGDIVIVWDEKSKIDFHCKVEQLNDSDIITIKMASNGIPLNIEDRKQLRINKETFLKYKIFFNSDTTNDRHLWPASVKAALLQLYS